MGAYFVLYPQSRVLTLIPLIIFWEIIELPAIFLLGFWFLMQLFSAGAIAVTAEHAAAAASPSWRTSPASSSAIGVFVFRSASDSARGMHSAGWRSGRLQPAGGRPRERGR